MSHSLVPPGITVLLALGLSASARGASSGPAIAQIAEQFDKHPLIMIGELHRWAQLHAFLRDLIRDPRFICRADDIVVEFGNSRLQDVADAYASGRNVTETQLQRPSISSRLISRSFDVAFRSSRTIAGRISCRYWTISSEKPRGRHSATCARVGGWRVQSLRRSPAAANPLWTDCRSPARRPLGSFLRFASTLMMRSPAVYSVPELVDQLIDERLRRALRRGKADCASCLGSTTPASRA
jgi:hypothetical protein